MTMEQQVFGGELQSGRPARPLWDAMLRGFRGRCPHCGEEIYHHRADDLPAYLVIVIVGHITLGGFLAVEVMAELPMWVHMVIWIPLTIALALALLRPIKGAIVGLQWALYMHGFSGEDDALDSYPEI
jgi:uncharacterized protein (DUF983 family)